MNGRTPARRLLAAILTAAAVVAGTAACGAPAEPQGPGPAAAPTVRLTVAPAGTMTPPLPAPAWPPTAAAGGDHDVVVVEKLAVDWLVAYRTAGYTGPADAWIDRTAPYVTPELAGRNNQLRAGSRGPGIAWQDFTQHRCTARVLDPAAVIPPEAPRTDTTVHVQAAGTLRTTCAAGTNPPDEALAVTLTAVRTTAGWRITSRDY